MAGFSSIMSAIGLIGSFIQARNQEQMQDRAINESRTQALAQEQRAVKAEKQGEMEMNRANQKKPNVGTILAAAQQASKGGASGTMLTGPGGVDPNALTLGRTSLLGQ
jgi:hypothetical protein